MTQFTQMLVAVSAVVLVFVNTGLASMSTHMQTDTTQLAEPLTANQNDQPRVDQAADELRAEIVEMITKTIDEAVSRAIDERRPTVAAEPMPVLGNEFSWIWWVAALLLIAVAAGWISWRWDRDWLKWVALIVAGVALSWTPWTWLIAVGIVAGLAGLFGLCRQVTPIHIRRNPVFIGLLLGVSSFFCALVGVISIYADAGRFDRFSIGIYEATQILLMNMTPHSEDVVTPPVSWWFGLARIFSVLFALFLAYRAIRVFFTTAVSHLQIGWYRTGFSRPPVVVFGLGGVGMEIVRDLRRRDQDPGLVVAVEIDESNPNIRTARELGAVVLVADATDSIIHEQLPIDAAEEIYVVAGDDQRNMSIAACLHRMSHQSRRTGISRWLFPDCDPICYVQLYDSDIQEILENKTYQRHDAPKRVDFRHFNWQQIAVRELVQKELATDGMRPVANAAMGSQSATNGQTNAASEVALYVVVGFGHVGREVALGLAQLAHFENRLRSRMLILCDDVEKESRPFLARYPRFSRQDCIHPNVTSVSFHDEFDDWEYVPVGEGQSKPTRYGVEITTNAIFTSMPCSPSDAKFLGMLRELFKATDNRVIKPAVIVCHEDWKHSYAWANEFAVKWQAYTRRLGESVPLTTYYWLPGQHAVRELDGTNRGIKPFGQNPDNISQGLLQNTLIRHLSKVVDNSYQLAVEGQTAPPGEELTYQNFRSNMLAGAHGLIKYLIAGRSIDWIFAATTIAEIDFDELLNQPLAIDNRTIEKPLRLDDTAQPDDFARAIADVGSLLGLIGEIEHNRWNAEALLRGDEWIEQEPPRVNRQRPAGFEHRRETLCPWSQIIGQEELLCKEPLKDYLQTYYLLLYLTELEKRI